MTFQELFSIVPSQERGYLEEAFAKLENDELDQAREMFNKIFLNSYSRETNSFAHYGLGVVSFKRAGDKDMNELGTSEYHIRESLETLKHADAYLVLGNVLELKYQLKSKQKNPAIDTSRQLIELANDAIAAFRIAEELNIYYSGQVEEQIRELEANRRNLESRINTQIFPSN